MKQLMRRFSRVADSSTAITSATTTPASYCLLRSETLNYGRRSRRQRSSASGKVPSGHVPVYVGDEMERFTVSADLLNHPVFVRLLNRSAQEYGYEQKGVLHIPCHVAVFECVLDALRSSRQGVSDDVLELIDALSPPSGSDDLNNFSL